MATAVASRGLEGIVATTSSICWIDGDAGVLSYRGIDIHELATHSTFEETTYLLWFGKLPNKQELADFTQKLAAARGASRLTADVSDSAQDFFRRRGFVATQRNTIELGGEWLATTTMEKRLAAKERAQ